MKNAYTGSATSVHVKRVLECMRKTGLKEYTQHITSLVAAVMDIDQVQWK